MCGTSVLCCKRFATGCRLAIGVCYRGAMARSSRRRSKTRRRAEPSRRTIRIAKRAAVAPASAETLLLDVARDVSRRAATLERAADVDTIVAALSSAYAPDAPLANALREDC